MFKTMLQRLTEPRRRVRRRKPIQRRLRMERLDKRELLAADINSIAGAVYQDLTGDGLTPDDERLAGVQVRLFRDGGDGVFGGDDIEIATQTSDAMGEYLFENLETGLYFLEQLSAPPGLAIPEPLAVDLTRNTTQTIDSFDQTDMILTASETTPAQSLFSAAPDALGGSRKFELNYQEGPSSIQLEVNTGNERVALSSSNATFGSAILRYDGDTSGIELVPDGLGGTDLSINDPEAGFLLQVYRNIFVADQEFSLIVYSGADQYSRMDRAFNPELEFINSDYLDFVRFADFTDEVGPLGPADFTDVGAIELVLHNAPDQNIRVSIFEAVASNHVIANLQNLATGDDLDLGIVKSLESVDIGVAGGRTATFRITVTRDGLTDATGVTIVDTLPTGMTFNSIGSVGDPQLPPAAVTGISEEGNEVTILLADIPAGAEPIEFLLIADIEDNVTGELTNSVVISSNEDDNQPDNDDSSAVVTLPTTDLSLTKSIQTSAGEPIPSGEVQTGDTIVYRLEVSNAGPDDATGVIVTDTLPADVTFIGATIDGGPTGEGISFDAQTGELIAEVGTVADGVTAVILVTVSVNPDADGLVTNAAQVTNVPGTDPDLENNTSSVETSVVRAVDLAITKALGAGSTEAFGGVVTYEITVSNDGPGDARGFTVTDVLPAGMTYLADSFENQGSGVSIAVSGQTLTFDGVPLASGDSVSFSFDALIDQEAPASLANSATVVAFVDDDLMDVDIDPSNNVAPEVVVDPTRNVDLTVTKSDGLAAGEVHIPGQPLVYTIIVTNQGVSDAVNVNVVDTLPAGVMATSITVDELQVQDNNPDQGILSFTIPSVAAAGGSVTVEITTNVGSALSGSITNSVTISGGGVNDPPEGNSATVTTELEALVDVGVALTGPETAVPGDGTIEYTLVIANTGPSVASDVSVVYFLPAGVNLQSVTLDGAAVTPTVEDDEVEFVIPQLLVGEANARTAVFTVAIDSSATGVIENEVVIFAEGNENEDDYFAKLETTLTPIADIGVSVTASTVPPATVDRDSEVTFTIDVVNVGPSDAAEVDLEFTLPAGLSFVSGSGPGGALTADGQVVSVDIGAFAADGGGSAATLSFTVVAAVDSAASGTLTSSAVVSTATDQGPDAQPNEDTAAIQVTDPQAGTTVTGVVFLDLNDNNVQDGDEDPLPGLTVNLRDADTNAVVQSATTDANGEYQFTAVDPGDYEIEVLTTPQFTGNTANPNAVLTNIAVAEAAVVAPPIGLQRVSASESVISGTVFLDLNGNGVLDANEGRAGGLMVRLLDQSGNTVLQSTHTNHVGQYRFDAVAPGDYIVEVVGTDVFTGDAGNPNSQKAAQVSNSDITVDFPLQDNVLSKRNGPFLFSNTL